MLRELLSIFRKGNEPLTAIGKRFQAMLEIANENFLTAGALFFGEESSAELRSQLYEKDLQINKLERKIRRRVAAHLSVPGNQADVPYCLLIMSLVKDVERLGDYAKNLSELLEIHEEPLPDDEIIAELREIRREVEVIFSNAPKIFTTSDRDQALHYIQFGRDLSHRCDALIPKIAKSEYSPGLATAVALATRYYKRFCGHVLNILSSVVMPLHKIDYFDENELSSSEE